MMPFSRQADGDVAALEPGDHQGPRLAAAGVEEVEGETRPAVLVRRR